MVKESTAVLLLEDGRFFMGTNFGATGESTGEVCFNTAMTGYQEILTDPSYCRQIVSMTFPHIGNYGINEDDNESDKIQVAGFVVKEDSTVPSNWRSKKSLSAFMKENKVVGIKNLDTRALARHIREKGALRGIISSLDLEIDSLQKKVKKIPSLSGLDLAREVTCRTAYTPAPGQEFKYRVAAIDYGIKKNILRLLEKHDCGVKVFPAHVSAQEILDFNPQGIFLSNGPGDPEAVKYALKTVKNLLGKKPIFGICLGHQILALALGGRTFKMKFGHRGSNHPVKNLETGRIEITSQNHGFAVDLHSLPGNVINTHVNLSDETSEGLECLELEAFSVQYHPESSPGPHDSRYLFNKFARMMDTGNKL